MMARGAPAALMCFCTLSSLCAVIESITKRDFFLKKAPRLARKHMSHHIFITSEFIQPFLLTQTIWKFFPGDCHAFKYNHWFELGPVGCTSQNDSKIISLVTCRRDRKS